MKYAPAAIYVVLAALVAWGLLLGVNASIDSQTEVLREIRNSTRAQVCVLAISPEERTPDVVAKCLRTNGL